MDIHIQGLKFGHVFYFLCNLNSFQLCLHKFHISLHKEDKLLR